MTLSKRFDPAQQEPELEEHWQAEGTYHFDLEELESTPNPRPVYSIDTPPPTVSGHLAFGARLFLQPRRFYGPLPAYARKECLLPDGF